MNIDTNAIKAAMAKHNVTRTPGRFAWYGITVLEPKATTGWEGQEIVEDPEVGAGILGCLCIGATAAGQPKEVTPLWYHCREPLSAVGLDTPEKATAFACGFDNLGKRPSGELGECFDAGASLR